MKSKTLQKKGRGRPFSTDPKAEQVGGRVSRVEYKSLEKRHGKGKCKVNAGLLRDALAAAGMERS